MRTNKKQQHKSIKSECAPIGTCKKNSFFTKLNLGAGKDQARWLPEPWYNVDIQSPIQENRIDIRSLPSSWSNSFYEVRASHVLEHFYLSEWDTILTHWVRVLVSGGVLRIILPDLDTVIRDLLRGFDSKDRPAYSTTTTTSVLAQIYGVGYDKDTTPECMRHRIIVNQQMIRETLTRQPLLTNINTYDYTEDPAHKAGLYDDSQNDFSLRILATKR